MLWNIAYGQSTIYLRGDTIRMQKGGGNATLIVENATRNVAGGVLTNTGSGVTQFILPGDSTGNRITRLFRRNDSVYSCVYNTCTFAYKDSTGGSGGLAGGNLGSSYRLYSPGSQGIKTLATPASVLIDSATSNTLTIQLDGDANTDSTVYANITTKGWKNGAFINTTGATPGQIPVYQGGKYFALQTLSFAPAGSTTYVQFNRNGSFTAVDSFTWVPNGLNIKGRYMIDGASVVYRPDQTNFLNSIFFGSLPASLSHTSGITGQYNTGVGLVALNALTSGASNVAVGSRAGQAVNTGINNTLVGDGAGITITSGGSNTAIGMAALSTNSTSSNNSAVGFESQKSTTGGNNTSIGWRSLHENSSGADNTGLGVDAGYQNLTGSRNVFVGSGAGTGAGSSSNSNNTGLGYRALFGVSTGGQNIAIGDSAAYSLTTGQRNIVIGENLTTSGATVSNELNIGGLIFGTGLTGTGTSSAGSMGIAVAPGSITARLHLPAGTATASTAPLKFTSGTNLTTPEAGAVEYDGTNWYGTNGTATRGAFLRTVTNVSNGASATLASGVSDYIFNGTTTTWTLPAVSGTTNTVWWIYNRGSGNITIVTTASANEIYSGSATNTATVVPGAWARLVSDGTFYNLSN